jgi:hypothetical protein
MLLGFVALGTEVGMWYVKKRTMQGAADSAAYSAAIAKNRPPGTSSIFTAQAVSVVSNYGYVDGSGDVTVAVNNPPKSGNYTTNNFAIEVTIQQPQKRMFTQLFQVTQPTLSARAVALLTTSSKCVYALNPKKSGSLNVDAGGVIKSACGMGVNSSSATAATISGTLTTPTFDIVGGYYGNINSPQINTGVLALSDPLFYVLPPSWKVNWCDKTDYSISSGTVTLSPGVYCGGITIGGTAFVTLSPGTYILMGGGLNVTGGTLNGTGVTLYNTGSALYPYMPIYMQNSPTVTLTAPTSGALAGILFFQDRSIVSTVTNILMGTLTGALYFPTTAIDLTSGSAVSVPYSIIVADTLSLSLNSLTIQNDYTSLAGGSPLKEPKLVE